MNLEKPKGNIENSEEDKKEFFALEKERAWKKQEQEVSMITDSRSKTIDEGIKETVTAFMIWKFPTTQSCEGHIEENGASHPWVQVFTSPPNGWREDQEKQKEWTMENLKQRLRMLALLGEFYTQRETAFDTRLCFFPMGFGGFRLQSMGAEIMPILPPEEQRIKREEYKKEMDDFTQFLRKKFFSHV